MLIVTLFKCGDISNNVPLIFKINTAFSYVIPPIYFFFIIILNYYKIFSIQYKLIFKSKFFLPIFSFKINRNFKILKANSNDLAILINNVIGNYYKEFGILTS
jgi:hypothetical protein